MISARHESVEHKSVAEPPKALLERSSGAARWRFSVTTSVGNLISVAGVLVTPSAMNRTRSHLRLPIRFSVSCKPGADAVFAAMVTDLSLGGARLEALGPLDVGTPLMIVAALDGAEPPSEISASVRWKRAGEVGLEFKQLGSRQASQLAMFLAHSVRQRGAK